MYGHLKGDNYLSLLANILKENHKATFFRIGGDEFAVLIKCEGNRNCIEYIEKIFTEIFNALEKINSTLTPKLSISVGIKKIDLNKDYLINYEETDKLLYKVKESGKNSFIIE